MSEDVSKIAPSPPNRASKGHDIMVKAAKWMMALGAGLYVVIFAAGFYLHGILGDVIYNRYIFDAWTPALVIAGALLFPGAILAEIVFQRRVSSTHRHSAGNGEKHGG